jgi:hypothetical protein
LLSELFELLLLLLFEEVPLLRLLPLLLETDPLLRLLPLLLETDPLLRLLLPLLLETDPLLLPWLLRDETLLPFDETLLRLCDLAAGADDL